MFVGLLFTCLCRCEFSDTITEISLISFTFQQVPLLLFTLQTQYQNIFSIKISRLPELPYLVLNFRTLKWYLKGNSSCGPGFIFLPITFVHFCISVLNQCNARQSKKSQITICGMINKSATYNLRLGLKKKSITGIWHTETKTYCCCCICCWNHFWLFLITLNSSRFC